MPSKNVNNFLATGFIDLNSTSSLLGVVNNELIRVTDANISLPTITARSGNFSNTITSRSFNSLSGSYFSGNYLTLKADSVPFGVPINSGEATLSMRAKSTRLILNQTDFYGNYFSYQPSLIDKQNISYYFPTFNSTVPITLNFSYQTNGAAVAVLPAVNSFFSSLKKVSYTGSLRSLGISPGSSNDRQFFRGINGYGGFYYKTRFALGNIDPAIAGKFRCFIGLSGPAVSALTNNPLSNALSLNNSFVGMGFESGDTTWSFIHNSGNSAALTKVSLGANYPCTVKSGNILELSIYSAPDTNSIGMYANIANSGDLFDVAYIAQTNIPARTDLIGPNLNAHNPDSNNTFLEFLINGVYVETFR